MKQINANGLSTLHLGRHGENIARQIVFDVSDWESEYGAGSVELIAQRPGDEAPYPVAIKREDTFALWDLTSSDTAVAGSYGRCELRYSVGDVLVKSRIWRTWVDSAMDTPSETAPPEPEKGWVDQVVAVGAAAKASADAAAQSAADAQNAKTGAETAKDAAVTAQGKAEDAQKGSEAARDRAEMAAVRQPYPNAETGTWWTWDADKAAYVDSGEPYEGAALYATFDVDPATGKLSVFTPARYHGPTFSLNEATGKLEVTVNG